jgi:cytochrome b561
MTPTTTPSRYNAVAIGLHWLIALMLIGLVVVGFVMGDLERSNPLKFQLYQLHKSFGMTVLALSLLRLVWRLTHRAPPLPAASKPWEKGLALAVHYGFYVLMLGLPLVGWLGVSTSPLKIPTVIFGLFTLPPLPFLQGIEGISHDLFELHEMMAFLLIGLFGLHVGAALKHHFMLKNDIVLRMTPRFSHGLLRALRGQKS